MRRLALLAALLLVTTIAPAATPASAGTPVFASENVDLLSTIPIEAAAIGGKVLSSDGTPYFVMTGSDGVTAYDISIPEVPVPVGFLPVPNFENEDVEMSEDLLLVVNDPAFITNALGGLYIIDISQLPVMTFAYVDPISLNRFRGSISTPDGTRQYFGSHTVSCVPAGDNDCAYAYAMGPGGGSDDVFVIDIRDPSNPEIVNFFESPVGGTHDVKMDDAGIAWFVGSGGFAAFDVSDPANPRLISKHNPGGLDYIHSSLRPNATAYTGATDGNASLADGEVLLITEEDYVTPGCESQGRFATASLEGFENAGAGGAAPASVQVLDRWETEMGFDRFPGTIVDSNQVAPVVCSAHWFDEQNGIVAIGWYQQGVRFLDVRDPNNIRQVGYFLTPTSMAWDAQWVTEDIAYSVDNVRGLDILRIADGGLNAPSATAPVLDTWFAPTDVTVTPDPVWGYGCAIVRAA